jgi:hypothetical protein
MYINELRERMEKLEKKLKPVKADSTPTPMTQKRKKAK